MNDEFVSIGILDHGHVTNWRFKRVCGKPNIRALQFSNGSIEIFHLECRASSLVRWPPIHVDVGDGEGVLSNFIFNPATVQEFARLF